MWELPPEIACLRHPTKQVYQTADEASCALREVSVAYMERGVFDPRLMAFSCEDHFHLGRPRADTPACA